MLEPPVRIAMLTAMPKLLAFAISLCRNRDQAEDLVQDTLLRACANIKSFTPGTDMLAWLCTILKNHFLSQCRKNRRSFEPLDDHPDSVASKPTANRPCGIPRTLGGTGETRAPAARGPHNGRSLRAVI
jgi:RNA polymerase sigma-70 factor (ECF subfamily)